MSINTYSETSKIKHLLEKETTLFQLSTTQLYNKILENNEGELTELGAINASTGNIQDVHQKINLSLLNLHIKIILTGAMSINHR